MKKLILTLCLAATGTFAAVAQMRLTLDQALDLALSENPTVKVAEMEVQRYDYVKRQTWGGLLPQVSVTGQVNHSFIVQQMSKGFSLGNDPYTTLSGAVDASVPLFAPQVYRMMKMNDKQMATAVEAARSSRITLTAEVKKAFYNILLAEQSLDVLRESEATVQRTVDDTQVQYQNGHYTVTYLPCGSGQAVLLSDTEHAMLIDCGSYRNAARQVREWLRWNGLKRLDTVVLTAVDQGHARNLPELMETVEVGELLMPAGCQERKTNADLLSFVHEREAREISEPVTLANPIAPVEIFPVTEGKLAVSIADEVLILHSPTEKQLSAYLEQNTLPAAAELVLSANHLSSGESMAQYVEAAGAQHIIIAASSEKGLRSHKELDVQSTYKEGEIVRQFKKE